MVTAVSAASTALSPSTGSPETRADSSSSTIANRARPATASVATMTSPSATTTRTSDHVTVRIDPNRYGTTFTAPASARLASTTASAIPP
ncbi:MAG: hypothetical protein KatS3mg009_0275 [Acidimicrobiia bacterium]|nr:MAG: hypothetical protein KatS3mg009_0275 [Acidimicrobiia bacterium]